MAFSFVQDAATIGAAEYSLPADSTTLAGQTDDCELEVVLDVSTLTFANQYRWRAYETINGGTRKPYLEGFIAGAMTQHVRVFCGLVGVGWDFTLQKITGPDQSIGWTLAKKTDAAATGDVNVITWLGAAPNALVAGRVDSSTGAMAANVMTAAAAAADLTTELQAGLALSTQVDALEADTTSLLARLTAPRAAALDNLDATVSSRATSAALTAVGSDVAALGVDLDSVATATAALAADVARLLGLSHDNVVIDNTVFDVATGVLTAWRARVFANAGSANAATDGQADGAAGEIYRWTGTATPQAASQFALHRLVRAL